MGPLEASLLRGASRGDDQVLSPARNTSHSPIHDISPNPVHNISPVCPGPVQSTSHVHNTSPVHNISHVHVPSADANLTHTQHWFGTEHAQAATLPQSLPLRLYLSLSLAHLGAGRYEPDQASWQEVTCTACHQPPTPPALLPTVATLPRPHQQTASAVE